MTKTKRTFPKIRLAVWSGRPETKYWGDDSNAQGYLDTCLMTRLCLRADDRMHDDASAVTDLVLKVWMDTDGAMSVEPLLHDAYLMGSSEVEKRLRLLKALERKLEKAGFHRHGFTRDQSVFDFLLAVCTAIGIRDTCTYKPNQPGAEPERQPIVFALNLIADFLTQRLTALRQRRSA